MRRGQSAGATALLIAAVLAAAFVWALPTAGAAAAAPHAKHKSKSKFKLGDYRVFTSPAIMNGVKNTRYVMEFKLSKRKYDQCGGPKNSKQTVFCLAAAYRIGEYGTEPTTPGESWCVSEPSPDTESSYGWMPVLRLPSSGRISVDKNVYDEGVKAAQVKATFKITTSGKFTGSFQETNWVFGGGPEFLGCTTGDLTLKGKWDASS